MPILEFVDSNGATWRVWNTVPSTRNAVSGQFEHGWLTFESETGRKRLVPVPPDWDSAPAQRLELSCRAATDVARRSKPVADAGSEADSETA